MKRAFLLLLTLLAATSAFAQSKMACCPNPSATQKFAMLASDKSFVMSHPIPGKIHFQSSIGKAITYRTADGKTADAFVFMAKNPTDNYLLVIHEYWGLNDWIKQVSEQLYHDLGNINVIDLDLYDGKVATTREDAGKYMQAVNDDRAEAIIKGAIAYVGPKARIATIGWCFGGGWSLQTALLAGKQAIGCVMYYGMPEQDVNKLKTLNCDVLGNFANKDKWITTGLVTKFEENMKVAGKKLTVHEFDADHAFANPSSPSHDGPAAKQAYASTIEFLKPRL
jgi:carboxymethylenebutenolidase